MSNRKYFGTDGIRGRVGDAPITPDFVRRDGSCRLRCRGRRCAGR
ncbi:hypothetical protein, partial [Pseudomonas aeruginosa]